MSDNKFPATTSSAKPCVVPDHFDLHDNLQLALMQLGDGFFPLEHTVTVNNVLMPAKDANGKCIAGSGLHVIVYDFLAMVDGVVIGGKNAKKFAPVADQVILTVPANATSRILLSTPKCKGTDGDERPDYVRGVLSVVPVITAPTDDQLSIAIVNVPNGATQVTNGMITDERKYLKNVDDLSNGGNQVSEALFDLANVINIAKTNFKVDSLLKVQANALFNGFVDGLVDNSGIDAGLSSASGYAVDATLTRIIVRGAAPSGLVAYYNFEEPGGSAIIDASGNGNNGILQGNAVRSSVGGIAGQYIDFRGDIDATSDAGVLIPNPTCFNGLTAVTIACWIYQRTLSPGGYLASSDQYLYQWATGDSINTGGSLGAQPCSNGFSMTNTGVNWAANTWTHVAFTFDAGLASPYGKLFVNGLPVSTSPNGGAVPLNTLPPVLQYYIGWNGGGAQMNGYMDEYAIFNRVLTDGEVLALKNNIAVTFSPPTLPITIVSKAYTATASPDKAMLVADDSGDVTYFVSRDNGATWAAITPNVLYTFGGAAGTQMRYKAVLPALTSYADNIGMFWA